MVVPQVRMGMWVGRVQQRKSGDDRGDRQVVLERQSSVYIVDYFYACLVWHTTRPPPVTAVIRGGARALRPC